MPDKNYIKLSIPHRLFVGEVFVRRKPPVRLGVQYSFSDEKPTKNLL